MPPKTPKIASLPRKMGWWILWPSKHPAAHQKANKTHSRPFLAGGYIEKATGVPKSTVLVWCEDQEHFSTVQGWTVENPPSVFSADGKTYPSERLNAARRQLTKDELRELVRKLRFEHKMSYPMIEQATGVPFKTCQRWCDEDVSGLSSDKPENSIKVQGADKKEYPAERLSPVDLAERRRRVRELRNAGYTLEEIAEELGVSLGTAQVAGGLKGTVDVFRPSFPGARIADSGGTER